MLWIGVIQHHNLIFRKCGVDENEMDTYLCPNLTSPNAVLKEGD